MRIISGPIKVPRFFISNRIVRTWAVGLAMQNICAIIPMPNLLCHDIAVDGLDTPTTSLYDTLAVLSG